MGGRVVPSTYVLGPDDEISIRVIESEEISEEPFRIDPGGDISLPLVGRVRAAGRTPQRLETELTERLRAFIHEPQVLVHVTQFRSQPVSVIGAVNKPGIHQLEGHKSLIEILSLAGGPRQDAGHTVKITRRREWGPIPLESAADDPSGRFQVAEVSLEAVMEARNPEENVLIMPHDVISVPRAEMIYVIGGGRALRRFCSTRKRKRHGATGTRLGGRANTDSREEDRQNSSASRRRRRAHGNHD